MKVETKTPHSIDTMPTNFLHNIDKVKQLAGFRSTSSPFVLPQAIATQNEIIQQIMLCTPDFKSDVGRVARASADDALLEHRTCNSEVEDAYEMKIRVLLSVRFLAKDKMRVAILSLVSTRCYGIPLIRSIFISFRSLLNSFLINRCVKFYMFLYLDHLWMEYISLH